MKVHLATYLHLLLLGVALVTGCGPPFYPAIYRARSHSNVYNGGLLDKEYKLTQDVALVRQGIKRPVLAPATPLPPEAVIRTGGPSRALNSAWGIWGEQHLACYRAHCESPCDVPPDHDTVARGVRLTIASIMVEDLQYPPPVFYVQARLQSGPHRGLLVDISELVEDCVPPDSTWRKLPVVVNDNYLQPVVPEEPPVGLEALTGALESWRWEVRFQAVRELGNVNEDPAAVVATLLYAKEDPDPEVAYEAIESLGKLGPRAEGAVPSLVAAMKRNDKPDGYCRRAAYALASIGRPVSPVLVNALQDRTWRLRYLAAEGLASLGMEAAPALPVLFEVLRSPAERETRDAYMYIGRAIDRIAPEEATREFIRLLRDGDKEERSQAARAIGAIAPAGEQAIPLLMEIVEKERFMSRVYAIDALGKFGDKAAAAVPIIVSALEDSSEPGIVSTVALNALGEIGPAAKEAIPAIERFSRRASGHDRKTALRALRKIRGGE